MNRNKRDKMNSKRTFLQSLYAQDMEYFIHLFTEGETEERYIQDLSRNKCVKVKKEGQDSSPHVLYEKALNWTKMYPDFFKRGKEHTRHVVWVLFDDDEKNVAIATTAKLVFANQGSKWPISIGYQKPCIELWGALCVKGSASGLPKTHSSMESALAKLMPGFDHDRNPRFNLAKMTHTDEACNRAHQWENSHGAFPTCTNATYYAGIHGLVELINGTSDKTSN